MKEELFNELLESIKQSGQLLQEERNLSRFFDLAEPDVAAIRKSFRLSQRKFAELMGISVGTLRNWEHRRRVPERLLQNASCQLIQ
jgi:putative transcriptional regulator